LLKRQFEFVQWIGHQEKQSHLETKWNMHNEIAQKSPQHFEGNTALTAVITFWESFIKCKIMITSIRIPETSCHNNPMTWLAPKDGCRYVYNNPPTFWANHYTSEPAKWDTRGQRVVQIILKLILEFSS